MLKIAAGKTLFDAVSSRATRRVGLRPVKTTKKNKSIARKQLKDFHQELPVQMELFGFAQPQNKQYSNTIELYDLMPKFVWGKLDRINDKFLDTIEREFECRGCATNCK